MLVMFWKKSSMLSLMFPGAPAPWNGSSGKNLLLSDLLQKISVEETVQVGGGSSREPRLLWNQQTSSRTTFQRLWTGRSEGKGVGASLISSEFLHFSSV